MYALILDNKIVDVSETKFGVSESLSWIDCPDNCKAGEWTLVNGVPTAPPPAPEKTYSQKRMISYLPIRDQLDMLYWDKVNSTDNWQDAIAKVKSDNPKPE